MIGKITSIGKDKLLHFSVSAVLSAGVKAIAFLLLQDYGFAVIIALLLTLFIGINKEIYDKASGNGLAEWKDLFADILGAGIGAV